MILRKLNDKAAKGNDQNNVNKTAFVQQKLFHEPNAKKNGPKDPEHYGICLFSTWGFVIFHRLVGRTVPFESSIARKPMRDGSPEISSAPEPNGSATIVRGASEAAWFAT